MDLDLGMVSEFYPALVILAVASLGALWLAWSIKIGFLRGSLAAVCRAGWLLPLFVSFFPQTTTEQLPRSMALKPVHVLLDDSQSMRGDPNRANEAPLTQADQIIQSLNEECARLGCIPRVTRLSEQDEDTRNGYTPLAGVLESWIYKVGGEPWLVVSDGSDQSPTESWSSALRGAGKNGRGQILGFSPAGRDNVWIKSYNAAPFSFEDKPLTIDVTLKRARKKAVTERVQVQVIAQDQALTTVNAAFEPDELETTITATIPPLPRGQHLLTLRVLPTADETALWDNVVHVQVEVMPNTVGVLHLLGSPSWDGRFLRRYLKAEPKYDLISFFILRDPWDSQQVSERELSLIPFPVERLFREELPNFRVVVIQNFTLFQFLLPEYQENLVKFVKDGGGLLFVGGPRALLSSDLSSSPLREILPFEVTAEQAASGVGLNLDLLDDMLPGEQNDMSSAQVDDKGPAYDESQAFKVTLAQPEQNKRALANVYDDWEALGTSLTSWGTAKGLHHMERVKFKAETTPLLTAKVANGKGPGKDVPLAVASYPGKGRAIWLFTDSLWRLGMTVSDNASRQVYNQFMQASMTWLMRQDLRQPLVAKSFSLHGSRRGPAVWRVALQGPAARYFEPSPEWRLTVCGTPVDPSKLVVTKAGAEEWELSGPLPVNLAGGERCVLTVDGTHPAFGSVKSSVSAVFPEIFKDDELDAAPQKLEELAQLTGASLHVIEDGKIGEGKDAILPWVERAAGTSGVSLPSRFKTLRNFYWIIDTPWFWLLMLLMPLEVVIRRWDQLFAGSLALRSTVSARRR